MKKPTFLNIATGIVLLAMGVFLIWGIFQLSQFLHLPTRIDTSMDCAYMTKFGTVGKTGTASVKGWRNHYLYGNEKVIIDELKLLDESVYLFTNSDKVTPWCDNYATFFIYHDQLHTNDWHYTCVDRDFTTWLIPYQGGYLIATTQDDPDYTAIYGEFAERFPLK